jgi:colanic acid/amylovoran biosynthesis glycosyltransferase
MCEYAAKTHAPLVTVNPDLGDAPEPMDMVDVPVEELTYRVMTLETDRQFRLLPAESVRLRDQIAKSALIYGGDWGAAKMARDLGVPYILLLEFDLSTNIKVSISQVSSPAKKAVRTGRWLYRYVKSHIPDLRHATGVHCNSYPVLDESKHFNSNCLLYLDSRMSAEKIITESALERRLADRPGRPLRLLFSGRLEPLKGTGDAVKVGLACLERGLNVEMHFYGQGSLKSEMQRLVDKAGAGEKIHIHEPVTFPELARISQSFDVFVCCHVQSDPSCTYLESFGAGLVMVGYGNRMWRRLHGESGVGFCTPMGRPALVAESIAKLASDHELLASMSRAARRFALEHTFEKEFSLRIDDLNMQYQKATQNASPTVKV